MRPADRLAFLDARGDVAIVELEAELAQRRGHAQGPLLAVGQEIAECCGERRVAVVDQVAEDVQFAGVLGAGVDRGDLDCGNDAHACARPGGDRLGQAGHGVVIAEGQQLDARVGSPLDHGCGLERPVGVGGVRLQVEGAGHRVRGSLRDSRAQKPAGSGADPMLAGATSSARTDSAMASRRIRTLA